MTVLHAAILSNGEKLYQNKTRFDDNLLHSDRDTLKRDPIYSDLFKYVVLSLTDRLPENRVSCEELYSWLKPNEDKILKLQPFGVNILPIKVQKYAESSNFPKHNQSHNSFDPTYTSIGKLESKLPEQHHYEQHHHPEQHHHHERRTETYEKTVTNQANESWTDIDEKIRRSKQMFPS